MIIRLIYCLRYCYINLVILHNDVAIVKKIKVELDLSNYAVKSDLKKAACIDTIKCAKKTVSFNLKSDIDRLDINKLRTTPVDFSNLNNVVKSHVAEKNVLDELLKKFTSIDSKKQRLEKRLKMLMER